MSLAPGALVGSLDSADLRASERDDALQDTPDRRPSDRLGRRVGDRPGAGPSGDRKLDVPVARLVPPARPGARKLLVAGARARDPAVLAAVGSLRPRPPGHRHRGSIRVGPRGRSRRGGGLRGVGRGLAVHLHRPRRRGAHDLLVALRDRRAEGRPGRQGPGHRQDRARPPRCRRAAPPLRRPDRVDVHRSDVAARTGGRERLDPPCPPRRAAAAAFPCTGTTPAAGPEWAWARRPP